jgi:protein-S-isoprenylcysteine O-methyltransferase Ste14
MPLREEYRQAGIWLFRWRSYLPVLMIAIVILGTGYFEFPGESEHLDDLWEIVCLLIACSGIGIRVFTIGHTPQGTSGTNTHGQVADLLNTTGMYSLVRHPLYLGNFIMWLGLSLFFRLWWITLLVSLIFWLYYERIMFAEEEYLREKFGDAYLAWANRTPAFIPAFKKWRRPDLGFCWQKALKNEYKSFFALIVFFTLIEIVGDVHVEHHLEIDRMWLWIFSVSALAYITIRRLKKKTRLLDVKGR